MLISNIIAHKTKPNVSLIQKKKKKKEKMFPHTVLYLNWEQMALICDMQTIFRTLSQRHHNTIYNQFIIWCVWNLQWMAYCNYWGFFSSAHKALVWLSGSPIWFPEINQMTAEATDMYGELSRCQPAWVSHSSQYSQLLLTIRPPHPPTHLPFLFLFF